MNYLPEVLLLGLTIGSFRPLVRRAGPHVNLWFLGWGFLLVYFSLLLLPAASWSSAYVLLASRWSLDLCAFSFVLVAERDHTQRLKPAIAALLAIPVLLASALATFPAHPVMWDRISVLLYLAPSLFLLFTPSSRQRQADAFGLGYLVIAALAFALVAPRADQAVDGTLGVLFLMAAWLFLRSSAKATRGVVAGVGGLAAWGLTFPLVDLLNRFSPSIHLPRTVLELPICIMAGGVILTLLEEHVLRTERLATHDPLTDLPNRRRFEERLIEVLEEARKDRTTVACLVIDVDNFKTVNDTMGHDAGDQLLRALASRLSWHMTPRDMLARTGGDEFTALLAGVKNEHHHRFVASAMLSAVSSVPIFIDRKPVDIRISVGIALSPDNADDTEGLRRAADMAMYAAKRRGGSLVAFAGDEEPELALLAR